MENPIVTLPFSSLVAETQYEKSDRLRGIFKLNEGN